jgi:hypothetical protein
MNRGTYNKISIYNGLGMIVWVTVALPVVAQDPPLFWPDFAAAGAHQNPVHSQAGKWLVFIQQGLQCHLPA